MEKVRFTYTVKGAYLIPQLALYAKIPRNRDIQVLIRNPRCKLYVPVRVSDRRPKQTHAHIHTHHHCIESLPVFCNESKIVLEFVSETF